MISLIDHSMNDECRFEISEFHRANAKRKTVFFKNKIPVLNNLEEKRGGSG